MGGTVIGIENLAGADYYRVKVDNKKKGYEKEYWGKDEVSAEKLWRENKHMKLKDLLVLKEEFTEQDFDKIERSLRLLKDAVESFQAKLETEDKQTLNIFWSYVVAKVNNISGLLKK